MTDIRKSWWKWLGAALLIYSVIAGILGNVPAQPILNETIRNLYYHVAMWFAMFAMATVSLVASIMYLTKGTIRLDTVASSFAHVALMFGFLGLITGAVWVNYTWNGDPDKLVLWVKEDIKLNGAALGVLIYLVYWILRKSIADSDKRGRFAAVYNIIAFVLLMYFTMVLPRLKESSLHPGNAGNPGFDMYDLNDDMRPIFYLSVLGWILIGVWIAQLRVRYTLLKNG